MAFNPDQLRYLLICSNKGEMYVPERDLADMTSGPTLRDIASGEIENLVSVTAFNPITRTCIDATEDVAIAVMGLWAKQGEPLTTSQYEFVEMHVSTQAANSFRRAA